MRKIIQISTGVLHDNIEDEIMSCVYALCNDGTLWSRWSGGIWHQIEDIPQDGFGEEDRIINKGVSHLGLSARSANCLRINHINTIRQLVVLKESDVMRMRNLGKTSFQEIRQKLACHALHLGMEI
jgi:DNA-directed RNA polymerase alpha subunit